VFIHKLSAEERTRYCVYCIDERYYSLLFSLFLPFLLIPLSSMTLWIVLHAETGPVRIPPPIPFNPFVYFFFFLRGRSTRISFDSQKLAYELPALGGTNPYPLAPTMTPLVSALLGGGPGGNNTGPTKKGNAC